jgi:hypothetical protein
MFLRRKLKMKELRVTVKPEAMKMLTKNWKLIFPPRYQLCFC